MPDKSVVAVIPARAGSKRLPGKNKKLLLGKPLIQWTIDAALSANIIDKVVVSTDCPEIAEIARSAGAEVPFLRPPELSSDNSTCIDVVEHVLTYYSEQNVNFSHVALLQPTSPLRTSLDIDEAFSLLLKSKSEAVTSVSPCEHPPMWSNVLPSDNSMSDFLDPLLEFRKSGAKAEVFYRLNGAICICTVAKFLQERSFYFKGDIVAFKMPTERSVDIDHPIDFKLAECLISEKIVNI